MEAKNLFVRNVARATVGSRISGIDTSAKPLRREGCRMSGPDPKASVSRQRLARPVGQIRQIGWDGTKHGNNKQR